MHLLKRTSDCFSRVFGRKDGLSKNYTAGRADGDFRLFKAKGS